MADWTSREKTFTNIDEVAMEAIRAALSEKGIQLTGNQGSGVEFSGFKADFKYNPTTKNLWVKVTPSAWLVTGHQDEAMNKVGEKIAKFASQS